MPWFFSQSELLDVMADIAGDPEKLAAFKDDPEAYLEGTSLDAESKRAILSDDHATVVRALMSKVDPEA